MRKYELDAYYCLQLKRLGEIPIEENLPYVVHTYTANTVVSCPGYFCSWE